VQQRQSLLGYGSGSSAGQDGPAVDVSDDNSASLARRTDVGEFWRLAGAALLGAVISCGTTLYVERRKERRAERQEHNSVIVNYAKPCG
jgi:hypothetical protein